MSGGKNGFSFDTINKLPISQLLTDREKIREGIM